MSRTRATGGTIKIDTKVSVFPKTLPGMPCAFDMEASAAISELEMSLSGAVFVELGVVFSAVTVASVIPLGFLLSFR